MRPRRSGGSSARDGRRGPRSVLDRFARPVRAEVQGEVAIGRGKPVRLRHISRPVGLRVEREPHSGRGLSWAGLGKPAGPIGIGIPPTSGLTAAEGIPVRVGRHLRHSTYRRDRGPVLRVGAPRPARTTGPHLFLLGGDHGDRPAQWGAGRSRLRPVEQISEGGVSRSRPLGNRPPPTGGRRGHAVAGDEWGALGIYLLHRNDRSVQAQDIDAQTDTLVVLPLVSEPPEPQPA